MGWNYEPHLRRTGVFDHEHWRITRWSRPCGFRAVEIAMAASRAMRICFIGDSFVSGAFDSECLGWVGRISASARERGHDVSPYNLGIRGETSVQIARRWRAEAESRQTAQQEGRLVFEFGVNDVREVNGKPQLEAAQSLAAAGEILGAASQWKPTLMIGPPPGSDEARNARVAHLSNQLLKLCAGLKIPYFDSYTPLMGSAVWLPSVKAVDGTHPSAAGYAEWAAIIDAWPDWRGWLP
jgi:lysophospholipase L1-like esterase